MKRPSLNIKRNIFLVNVNVRVHMISFIIKSWFYYCVSLNLQFISIFRAAWNIFTNSSRKQSLSADQGSINQNVLIQIGGRNINTHKIVETMVWQYHNLKYGQYSATEVTKFQKKIWSGDTCGPEPLDPRRFAIVQIFLLLNICTWGSDFEIIIRTDILIVFYSKCFQYFNWID